MREFAVSDENAKPNSDVSKIKRYGQDVQHDIIRETITSTMIGEGEIKIEIVATVVKIVTKVDGTVYHSAALT